MKIKIVAFVSAILIAGFCLAGCSTPPIYVWENYQDNIYSNLKGGTSIESQISAMEKDLQKILSKNKKVPPGFYAHLGMLTAEANDPARARECFNEEKKRFPESAVLMDRFLARLGR